MKKVFLLFILLSTFLSSEAQKYLRYHMNDSTFHGAYTNTIDSIVHDCKDGVATTCIQSFGKTHEIPLANISHISIEDANILNDNIGDYRIYEFNYAEEDVKKIYVDNRASLFASHNGDFGANDTILYSSAYNDITYLFITDNQGRIKKFFDGKNLLYFDYSDDEITILDLSTNKTDHFRINKASRVKGINAGSGSATFFSNLSESKSANFMCSTYNTKLGNDASRFAQNINDISNNPELRNQLLIVDGLSIAGDLLGIASSLLAEPFTFGWSTAGIAVGTASLMYNMTGLLNHIWPDSEQMERYKEYYRNKYAITIKTINPINVKSDKADLRGTFMSSGKVKGNLYFSFSEFYDFDMCERINGATESVSPNSYIVNGSVHSLKPGTDYYYTLWFECEVDGMSFSFSADTGMDFTTPKPLAKTLGTESVNDRNAVVKCSFENVPEGATCGIIYGFDGNYSIASTSSTDGERTVNITGLQPNTTYDYQAYIQYDGKSYCGETISFTTEEEDIPDLSGTWIFNQSYIGKKSVTMNLELVRKGKGWASYKARGFYGVITFGCTVHSDRSVNLSLNALNGACGAFSGVFNESYTSVTGDSFIHCPDNNNWAVSPWTVDEPWSFSR